jgi:hypothetical protein
VPRLRFPWPRKSKFWISRKKVVWIQSVEYTVGCSNLSLWYHHFHTKNVTCGAPAFCKINTSYVLKIHCNWTSEKNNQSSLNRFLFYYADMFLSRSVSFFLHGCSVWFYFEDLSVISGSVKRRDGFLEQVRCEVLEQCDAMNNRREAPWPMVLHKVKLQWSVSIFLFSFSCQAWNTFMSCSSKNYPSWRTTEIGYHWLLCFHEDYWFCSEL